MEGGCSYAHLIIPLADGTNSYSGVQIAHAWSLLQNGHFARNEKRPGVSEVIYMALMASRAAVRVWGRIHQLLKDHVTGPHFCLQEMVPDKLLLCNFIPHTRRVTALHMNLKCFTSFYWVELKWKGAHCSQFSWTAFRIVTQHRACHAVVCEWLQIIRVLLDGCSEPELFPHSSDTYSCSIYLERIVYCTVVIAPSPID